MRAVVLRVLDLTEGDFAAAEQFLQSKGRAGDASDVRAWRAALPPGEGRDLSRAPVGQPKAAKQLAEARKFVEERELISWVRLQNKAKSIAPTPGAVLEEASKTPGLARTGRNRHRWLRRVVSRWGGRKGVLRGGEQPAAEEFNQKAASAKSRLHPGRCQVQAKAAAIGRPESGPDFRPSFLSAIRGPHFRAVFRHSFRGRFFRCSHRPGLVAVNWLAGPCILAMEQFFGFVVQGGEVRSPCQP